MALTAGDSWLEKGANLLLFGPPGAGKSHLAAAIGLALIENGWRVLFMRTSDLVQRLQIARRELALESTLVKLDKYLRRAASAILYPRSVATKFPAASRLRPVVRQRRAGGFCLSGGLPAHLESSTGTTAPWNWLDYGSAGADPLPAVCMMTSSPASAGLSLSEQARTSQR